MPNSISALEKSLFWQRHVVSSSPSQAQRARAAKAIIELEAEIKTAKENQNV